MGTTTTTSLATSSTPGSGLEIGVNLAGGEFGSVPGTYGKDYTYPTNSEIDYYASKGMDVIRIPFLAERLQSSANAPLNQTALSQLDSVVNYATSKGLKVVLDDHDYGAINGQQVGESSAATSAFANFWGQMASHYANNPNVIFGLMNEPNQQTGAQWLTGANAAIAAIRQAGATQEILVPGSHWDGAWTWTTSDNASTVGTGIKDPGNNYAIEVHQYLDSNGSGTSATVVNSQVGVQRLTDITNWAEQNHVKLFLGEFGVASDSTSLSAMNNMLSYMQQHSDVWQGGTYWAGGPWWGNYMYSIEPQNGQDAPQMGVLDQYTSPVGSTPAAMTANAGYPGTAASSTTPATGAGLGVGFGSGTATTTGTAPVTAAGGATPTTGTATASGTATGTAPVTAAAGTTPTTTGAAELTAGGGTTPATGTTSGAGSGTTTTTSGSGSGSGTTAHNGCQHHWQHDAHFGLHDIHSALNGFDAVINTFHHMWHG